MNRPTALLVIFGAVAATATVVALRINVDDDRDRARMSASARTETAEESQLRDEYLTQYSQRKFAPLFAMIADSVSSEKRAHLGEILARREIAAACVRDGLAHQAVGVALDSQHEALKEEITRELGSEVCAQVENYLQTLPQRPMLESINQILVYRGDILSVSQTERLCTVLHQCAVPTPGRRSSLEEWDVFVARKSAAAKKVAAAAAEFLSGKQRETLQQELSTQIAFLRFQRRTLHPPSEISGKTPSNHNGLDEPKSSS